jgi:hypothetical protein
MGKEETSIRCLSDLQCAGNLSIKTRSRISRSIGKKKKLMTPLDLDFCSALTPALNCYHFHPQ